MMVKTAIRVTITITVFASHKDGAFAFSGLHQDILVYRHATAVILKRSQRDFGGPELNA